VILHSSTGAQHAEVGFWLIKARRGQGRDRAVELMVDWGFGKLGLHRVEMITLPALPHRSVLGSRAAGASAKGSCERNFERGQRLDALSSPYSEGGPSRRRGHERDQREASWLELSPRQNCARRTRSHSYTGTFSDDCRIAPWSATRS
jgi:hypothetical protein